MNATISPTSGEKYHSTTPRRRVSTVEGLYQWAREKNIYDGLLPGNALLWPIGTDSSNEATPSRSRVTVHLGAEDDEPVHVMEFQQAKAIMAELGPLPREVVANRENVKFDSVETAIQALGLDESSSRDRLAAEYGLNSGLRISEIHQLNWTRFSGYNAETIIENNNYRFRIIGKGRKKRMVDIPGWLILETLCYIEFERKLIVASVGEKVNTPALLLNPLSVGKHKGKRVSVRTLERQFADACINTGNCELRERVEIKQRGADIERKTFNKMIPLFVFHDLRHTYAIWTYYVRIRHEKEPWLYIQARLGHAFLMTTMNKYLKVAGDFEAAVSDAFIAYIDEKKY
jgi:integrase/recombinase XerC